VAALREERLRLAGDVAALGPKDKTQAGRAASKQQRPGSAPVDRARRSWLLPATVGAKQTEAADRLSRPASSGQQGVVQSKGKGAAAKQKAAASFAAQREAAARMSSGTQAKPHAWEEFMSSDSQGAAAAVSTVSPDAQQRVRVHSVGMQGSGQTPAQANMEARKAASSASSRAALDKFINAEAAPLPSYEGQRTRMKALCVPSRAPVPKVETDGIGKGSIDWIEHFARQMPGPGAYEVQKAADLMFGPRGGRFSKSEPLSDVDRLVIDSASKPGPGEYKIKGGAELTPGGRFSGARPKSDHELFIERTKNQPGPGAYGNPKKQYFNKGGSGKFPFVYHPKDPKLKHLSKG
jgi:hypothetical protein